MRSSSERARWLPLGAGLLALAGCEVDACREEEAALGDSTRLSGAELSARDARCTRGDAHDLCPIEDCDASCPVYTIAGGSTVSVEPTGCRIDRAAAVLGCSYRILYDVCTGG